MIKTPVKNNNTRLPAIVIHVVAGIFICFLAARSCADIFTDVSFGPLQCNLAALMGIGVIILAAFYCFFIRKPLFHPVALLMSVWLLVNLFFVFVAVHNFGREGLLGAREWIRLVALLSVFFLSYNLISRPKDNFLTYLFLALPIPLIAAAYEIFSGGGVYFDYVRRIEATFVHPNALAMFLVLFFALTWYMMVVGRRQWLFMVLLFIEVFALVYTVNFGGYIVFGIISAAILFSRLTKMRFKILMCVVLAVFLVALKSAPDVRQKCTMFTPKQKCAMFTPKQKRISAQKPVTNNSFTWRKQCWRILLAEGRKHPVTGWGLHTSTLVNPYMNPVTGTGYVPHNDYVKYLVETGALGLIAYGAFIVFFLALLYREYKKCLDPEIKYLLYILFCVYIAFQVGSFADNYITATATQCYFWAAVAAALKWNFLRCQKSQ